ncbi:MAG: hypothetical protein O2907_09530 [Proteobacteria bacterium]|nr:hypothetical protein [Pseudomonadota bacterium]MDA1064547.1 hypothetical protein [Pseudomonadota bacterium]
MTDNNNLGDAKPTANDDQELLPLMQRILDNPFLLLVLGVSIPAVFYIIWGIIEITQIPIAD